MVNSKLAELIIKNGINIPTYHAIWGMMSEDEQILAANITFKHSIRGDYKDNIDNIRI